jgi:hypothetical protein
MCRTELFIGSGVGSSVKSMIATERKGLIQDEKLIIMKWLKSITISRALA